MTEREILLRRIAALDFSVLELHLYMNTHPTDKTTEQKMHEYRSKSMTLKKEYEEKFGPLTWSGGKPWSWISDPWPWDVEEK